MRAAGWSVPAAEAESARQSLIARGLLDRALSVAHEPGRVIFPVLQPPESLGAGVLVEREFEPYASRGPRGYQELVELPEPLRSELPRAYDVVGDIVLIRLPEALIAYSDAIGRALLRFVPGARVAGRDEGVHGPERRRRLVRIAGAGGWATRHRENGITMEVDLEAAYFSPRLAREHAAFARTVQHGERVLDLCCGIGPFALTVAHAGNAREIVAVDSNPAAIALLRANLERLGRADRVRPVIADVADFLPSAGLARRVVFNLPREGIKYLTSVGNVVEPGGTVRYYEVTERDAAAHRPAQLLRLLRPEGAWAVSEQHLVHPYSPRADLVAYTLARGTA